MEKRQRNCCLTDSKNIEIPTLTSAAISGNQIGIIKWYGIRISYSDYDPIFS